MENIISSLHDDGIEYIEERVSGMSLVERQIFFVNCIKVIDKSYYDYIMTKSDQSATLFFDILKYAYPVLIKYLWTKDFETLIATPLARADSDEIYRCRVFLCSCKIVGQTEYILDMEKYGYVSVSSKDDVCTIKHIQKNWWIEHFDSSWTNFYENLVFSLMEKDERITTLQAQWPTIQDEMRPLCFVWLKEFMGYGSTMNIENYFNDVAYYDSVHSTEWDYFPEQSKFNGVAYLNFTDAIIDSYGYAVKHLRFAELLQSSHPELLAENLFYDVRMEDETLRLIRENRECSEQDAYAILSCMSLSSDNSELYTRGQVNCAPLIKISRNQYLHSVAGSLFHPFSFLLSSLQQKFPNDFSRNANSREAIFRKQLYEIVGDSFTCINHNIVIKHGSEAVTDIDAVMVDKINGEIALFQLKWQNQTVDSIRSLHSKAQNYTKETMYWVKSVKHWIECTSEAEIAEHLGNGIKRKNIDKSKIFLFVLGRNHGNYSGEKLTSEKTVWAQWFQLLQCRLIIPKDFTIADLYNMLQKSSPFDANVKQGLQEYSIGPYKIIVESINDGY
jgi:hypothetical protein